MLKLILSSFLLILISLQGSLAQKTNEDSKIVTPDNIQKKELLKSKKANSTIQNKGELNNSNSNEENTSNEYPKKLSVGKKHTSHKEPIEKELTKEEKIENLENEIITVEWKINSLKESQEGDPEDIKTREEYLVQLRKELETLTKK